MHITQVLDAENTFSEELAIPGGSGVLSAAVTISGTGNMRVVVQTRAQDQPDWVDLFFATTAGRFPLANYGSGPMRFGVKTGDWVSGSFTGSMGYSRA